MPIATIFYTLSSDYSMVSSLRVPSFGYLKKEKAKRYVSRYTGLPFDDITIVNVEKEKQPIDFDLETINN